MARLRCLFHTLRLWKSCGLSWDNCLNLGGGWFSGTTDASGDLCVTASSRFRGFIFAIACSCLSRCWTGSFGSKRCSSAVFQPTCRFQLCAAVWQKISIRRLWLHLLCTQWAVATRRPSASMLRCVHRGHESRLATGTLENHDRSCRWALINSLRVFGPTMLCLDET